MLTTELSGHHDFATLGAALHDETEHTVASTANGETTDELVTERLSLGNCAEATSGDLLGVEFDGVFRELEVLLNDGGQLADAAASFTQNVEGSSGQNDDFPASGGNDIIFRFRDYTESKTTAADEQNSHN